MRFNPAQRRYNRRVLITMAVYAVVLFGAVYWFRNGASGPPALRYAVAVLPALPLIGVFVILGRYLVEETDEYVRMLMVRQALVATALTLSTATVWGFLETFDLVPHIVAYWAATIWFAGLGVGACVNKLLAARAR